jgi:hypothetical protein
MRCVNNSRLCLLCLLSALKEAGCGFTSQPVFRMCRNTTHLTFGPVKDSTALISVLLRSAAAILFNNRFIVIYLYFFVFSIVLYYYYALLLLCSITIMLYYYYALSFKNVTTLRLGTAILGQEEQLHTGT